ncbi:heparan-alpha-glucosaminide N-acetyltransferase [Gymnodinialimonas sp. 2305UL16-5]|uniref:heparan-alpha-glucosaminide N-acetyltransferase n=1 Tax=Gymnodinialimonas mytili TaxID=3126503 RepID=UPI0030B6AC83
MSEATSIPRPRTMRIPALDIVRSLALCMMVVFHFVFDLEMFGHVPPSTATTGFWRALAVTTAGSFLFLAGVSLYLAHGEGIRWRAFGRRLAILLAAALAVTIGTYLVFPQAFVFFGILHSIALCSLLGLAVLRLPALLIAALAIVVFYAPDYATSDLFNARIWWWTGLQNVTPTTMDYEPIFPWFAPFLAGLAAAKAAAAMGLWARLGNDTPPRTLRVVAWPGQHSLIIYLLHQPVLIGLVGGVTFLIR